MPQWVPLVFVIAIFGLSTALWSVIGAGRWICQAVRVRSRRAPAASQWGAQDVAVLIAAHNEELVIADTLERAATQFPRPNIFVISDGSSDATALLARAAGVNVLELSPNRGKAGALVAGIEHFDLAERFEFVLLLDADTHLSADYRRSALALFDSDEVVAVAGRASTLHPERVRGWGGKAIVWYRERLYCAVQYLHKYGQAAARIDVVSIVPGFASLYRTRILKEMDIAAPGLVIEDYNMTFEVRARNLGRVAFHPESAIAYTQDPDNVYEYARQVGRWSLGFWQTVRRHRPRWSLFWTAVCGLIAETMLSAALLIVWTPVFVISATCAVAVALGLDNAGLGAQVVELAPPWMLVIGLWVPDLFLTTICAALTRRPRLLQFALVFPFLRILDAAKSLQALGSALGARHDTGQWVSPTRRTTDDPGSPGSKNPSAAVPVATGSD